MTTIADAAIVTMDGKRAVCLSEVRTVDGHRFFKLAKSDHQVVRLLTGKSVGDSRVLTQTNIIEQLVGLRNEKYTELMTPKNAVDDLGVDTEGPKLKRPRLDDNAPQTLVVQAPCIGNVQGIELRVITAVGSAVVWVELLAETIDYLKSFVAEQLVVGGVPVKARRAKQQSEDAHEAVAEADDLFN